MAGKFDRDTILKRLRAECAAGTAIYDALCGSGITAKMAARGGYGTGGRVQIFVAQADLARARSVESRFIREQVPDVPEDFDPDNLASDRCPACDAQLPAEAQACPECELTFHR